MFSQAADQFRLFCYIFISPIIRDDGKAPHAQRYEVIQPARNRSNFLRGLKVDEINELDEILLGNLYQFLQLSGFNIRIFPDDAGWELRRIVIMIHPQSTEEAQKF